MSELDQARARALRAGLDQDLRTVELPDAVRQEVLAGASAGSTPVTTPARGWWRWGVPVAVAGVATALLVVPYLLPSPGTSDDASSTSTSTPTVTTTPTPVPTGTETATDPATNTSATTDPPTRTGTPTGTSPASGAPTRSGPPPTDPVITTQTAPAPVLAVPQELGVTPTPVISGREVALVADGRTIRLGEVEVAWGDGLRSLGSCPQAVVSGLTASHLYTRPGRYAVRVFFDPCGERRVVRLTVDVAPVS